MEVGDDDNLVRRGRLDHRWLYERLEVGRAKQMTLTLGKLPSEGIRCVTFVLPGEGGSTFTFSAAATTALATVRAVVQQE